jgi:hypothetical protein
MYRYPLSLSLLHYTLLHTHTHTLHTHTHTHYDITHTHTHTHTLFIIIIIIVHYCTLSCIHYCDILPLISLLTFSFFLFSKLVLVDFHVSKPSIGWARVSVSLTINQYIPRFARGWCSRSQGTTRGVEVQFLWRLHWSWEVRCNVLTERTPYTQHISTLTQIPIAYTLVMCIHIQALTHIHTPRVFARIHTQARVHAQMHTHIHVLTHRTQQHAIIRHHGTRIAQQSSDLHDVHTLSNYISCPS